MAPPLSHHRIFELLPPFSRRGLAVDLSATARLERRLAFKPRAHAVDGIGAVDEFWLLDDDADAAQGRFRLLRRLVAPGGLVAEQVAEGDDIEALLASSEAMAIAAQFEAGEGFVAAFSHALRVPSAGARALPQPLLTSAQVRLLHGAAAGVQLVLSVSRVGAIAGDLRVTAAPDSRPDWPEDLLAVLGRDWSRLLPVAGAWRTLLRLPRREPARSAAARQRLLRAALHLAATLADSPQHFHPRHRAARWVFALRRAVPLAVCVALIGGALAVPLLDLPTDSVWRMLIFNAPPLLLVAFFALHEMPRFEVPPLPRALARDAW